MSGLIIGLQNKINKYKHIVKDLLNKQELSQEQKEFLGKEKIDL